MAFNVGNLRNQIELYAGLAGVAKDKIKPELVYMVINQKMREFISKTGVLSTKAEIDTVADQQEYELPDNCIHITKVVFDDYRADKILFEQVEEIAGNV